MTPNEKGAPRRARGRPRLAEHSIYVRCSMPTEMVAAVDDHAQAQRLVDPASGAPNRSLGVRDLVSKGLLYQRQLDGAAKSAKRATRRKR